MSPRIDSHTPHLTGIDSRGLPVRQVAYWRQDVSALTAEARVTAQHHDAAGRLIVQRDPRLLAPTARPNLTTVYSLSGAVLLTDSVDAGWRLGLPGEAGQVLERWDGRGSQRRIEYDDQLRPLAVFEQAVEGESLCTERYGYGGAGPEFAVHNQCGQPIRHDDQAGTQLFAEFGLTGGVLEQARHFLRTLDCPDWPALVADRDKLLETGDGATTRSRLNPLGEVIEQKDAKANQQFFQHTVAGQLHEVRLQLKSDNAPKTLISAIQYNAYGQVEKEVAGNGVITTLEYAAEDGRLGHLMSRIGQQDPLQDLRYAYDPVGNVLSIEDAALPISYFANQRIEPINRYRYDSLYQLTEATGWEAGAANQGPSSSLAADPAAVGNYRQTYRYDGGNNLLELTHVGPQNPGHRLVADAHSNRCLPVREGVEPGEEDFRNGFDANGNLRHLQPGQALNWDVRNQLFEVLPVARESGPDDRECYVYGASGMRVRKVRSLLTNAQTNVIETRYVPSLDIRTHSGTGEELHVVVVPTGRGSVRVLHWETEPPAQIVNNQQRYSLTDHLRSSTLELDQDANVITQERYYPFGGTAWSNGEAVQVSYKTVRYSGKELDATGLYYYGFRYYAPWLQRWLNPDPLGTGDGLNLYAFCGNNPANRIDSNGGVWEEPEDVLMDPVLETFLNDEPAWRAELGLPPIVSRLSAADDDDENMSDQDATGHSPASPASAASEPDSPGSHSSGSSAPGSPGSPYPAAAPTAEQNIVLDILNQGSPGAGYHLNGRGLLVRSNFGAKVYRADRRPPEEVLRERFNPSDDFTAISKMISGEALIVSETLEGALFYAGQSHYAYNFYEIDASEVGGASLLENMLLNNQTTVAHIDAYTHVDPTNQTGQANLMHEAHLSFDELIHLRVPIVSLGQLTAQVNDMRATMYR